MTSGCPLKHHDMLKAVSSRLQKNSRCGYYTMEEVARHNHKDSAWIVCEEKVYDITPHVLNHKGWTCGCAVSTLMATLRVLGTDCTEEMLHVHSTHALRQLQPYMIGELVEEREP